MENTRVSQLLAFSEVVMDTPKEFLSDIENTRIQKINVHREHAKSIFHLLLIGQSSIGMNLSYQNEKSSCNISILSWSYRWGGRGCGGGSSDLNLITNIDYRRYRTECPPIPASILFSILWLYISALIFLLSCTCTTVWQEMFSRVGFRKMFLSSSIRIWTIFRESPAL